MHSDDVVGYARVDPWDQCLSHILVDLVDQSAFGEEPLLDIMPIAELMLGIGGTQKLHGRELYVFSPIHRAKILVRNDILCDW